MREGCRNNYRMYLDCEGAAYQTTGRGIFVFRWGFCTHMVVGKDPIDPIWDPDYVGGAARSVPDGQGWDPNI